MVSARARWMLALAVAVGCADPEHAGPDGGGSDATAPDGGALVTACPGSITVITHGERSGDTISFDGTIPGGEGVLDPSPGCLAGHRTISERVHAFTVESRSRVEVAADTDGMKAALYVRTACADASTELGCVRDDGLAAFPVGGWNLRPRVVVPDVAAGTVLYVVLDALSRQTFGLPHDYGITVRLTRLLAEGQPCDPANEQEVCEPGTVCSVAGGAPACAPPLGPPAVTSAWGTELENGHAARFVVSGTDPDGDVREARFTFFDAEGEGMDFDGDGEADELTAAELAGGPASGPPVPVLVGSTSFTSTFVLAPGLMSPGTLDRVRSFEVRLVDSTGTSRGPLEGPMHHPMRVGPGGACGSPDQAGAGELACEAMICAVPPAAEAACRAADATAAITASDVYRLDFPESASDRLRGSCSWAQGHGETLRRIDIAGPRDVRLMAALDGPARHDFSMSIREACADPTSEIACNDTHVAEAYFTTELAPGSHYLVIDGSGYEDPITSAELELWIELTPLRELGEPCTLGELGSIDGASDCAAPNYCVDLTGGTNRTCTDPDAYRPAICAGAPELHDGDTRHDLLRWELPSLFGRPSCVYRGQGSAELVYRLELEEEADVVLSTDHPGTDVDTVLFILDGCTDSAAELACSDDVAREPPNYRSTLEATLRAGTYLVAVGRASASRADGGDETAPNPSHVELDVELVPVRRLGQACDPAGVESRCAGGLRCLGTPPLCL